MEGSFEMFFEALIERISPKLKGIGYKISRASPDFSKEDLYQEAVLHLWADYTSGILLDKTDSYILQGCYFYLKNHIRLVRDRASVVSMNVPMGEDGAQWQDVLSSEEDDPVPSEGPDIDALMEELFKNGLSRKEKEIVFFYLQGWTTRRIAERLGVSHVSVVKAEAKIREKCRRLKNSV